MVKPGLARRRLLPPVPAVHALDLFRLHRDVSLLLSSVVPVLEGAVTFLLAYMTSADDGLGKRCRHEDGLNADFAARGVSSPRRRKGMQSESLFARTPVLLQRHRESVSVEKRKRRIRNRICGFVSLSFLILAGVRDHRLSCRVSRVAVSSPPVVTPTGDGVCLLTGPSTSPENSLPPVKNRPVSARDATAAEKAPDDDLLEIPVGKAPEKGALVKKRPPEKAPEFLFPFVSMSPAMGERCTLHPRVVEPLPCSSLSFLVLFFVVVVIVAIAANGVVVLGAEVSLSRLPTHKIPTGFRTTPKF